MPSTNRRRPRKYLNLTGNYSGQSFFPFANRHYFTRQAIPGRTIVEKTPKIMSFEEAFVKPRGTVGQFIHASSWRRRGSVVFDEEMVKTAKSTAHTHPSDGAKRVSPFPSRGDLYHLLTNFIEHGIRNDHYIRVHRKKVTGYVTLHITPKLAKAIRERDPQIMLQLENLLRSVKWLKKNYGWSDFGTINIPYTILREKGLRVMITPMPGYELKNADFYRKRKRK